MEYKDYVINSVNGDLKSYEYLVNRFQGMAISYAYSILHDFQLAEDAAQEAFILLYFNIKNLKEPAAFISWLRKIVFTCCNRYTRKKNIEVPFSDDFVEIKAGSCEVTEKVEENEKYSLVKKAISSLKREQQEVFFLYYVYNKSYGEIAIQLEISESTVANRLYSGKKKLKNILLTSMLDYLGGYVMNSEKFTRKVLEQVPHIIPQNSEIHENFYFCAAMRACAQYLKEDQIFDFISFAGISGSLFCNIWAYNPKWEYVEDITGCHKSPAHNASIEAAFKALGFNCDIITEKELKSNLLSYKQRIVDSLEKGLPVLTYGIVGYPCCSLITGYDENGDVLIGWSKFQDNSNAGDLPDGFETCGYFRKRNGLNNSHGLIFFGEKTDKPSMQDIFKKAVINIPTMADYKKTEKHVFGFEAYSHWADALECDEDFPEYDMKMLISRLDSHSGPLAIVLTGRLYTEEFLSRATKYLPEWKPIIDEAIALFNQERDVLFNIMAIQGGFSNDDPEIAKKLSAPSVRKEIAQVLRMARDINARAVDCLRVLR